MGRRLTPIGVDVVVDDAHVTASRAALRSIPPGFFPRLQMALRRYWSGSLSRREMVLLFEQARALVRLDATDRFVDVVVCGDDCSAAISVIGDALLQVLCC